MLADIHIRDGVGVEVINLAYFGKAYTDNVWVHGDNYTVGMKEERSGEVQKGKKVPTIEVCRDFFIYSTILIGRELFTPSAATETLAAIFWDISVKAIATAESG